MYTIKSLRNISIIINVWTEHYQGRISKTCSKSHNFVIWKLFFCCFSSILELLHKKEDLELYKSKGNNQKPEKKNEK